jgi:hypothetical protein
MAFLFWLATRSRIQVIATDFLRGLQMFVRQILFLYWQKAFFVAPHVVVPTSQLKGIRAQLTTL